MESNEHPVGVLRILESTHSGESCVEVTDVGFQSVGGVRNAWIEEVREGIAAGFLEASENIVVDGVQCKHMGLNDSLQMLPAQRKSFRRSIQKEFAISIQDSFLRIAGMSAESLKLQTGLEIPEQVDMTALYGDAVGLKHLCEPWQAINRDSGEDDAVTQKFLQESVEGFRRLFAGTESAGEQTRLRVPDQMLTVLPAMDVQ